MFLPHDEVGDVVACAYHDCDYHDVDDPAELDTEAFDLLLSDQGIVGETYWAFLALVMGRPLFPPKRDGWQTCTCLYGLGGTGKSVSHLRLLLLGLLLFRRAIGVTCCFLRL